MILEKKRIHGIGTVRSNRLAGCTFNTDADMKKKGRGAIEEKVIVFNGVALRAGKGFDNRTVILLFTFASANPITTVLTWDKKKKTTLLVKCPSIVSWS